MNAIAPHAQFAGAKELVSAWCAGLAPDPPITVDEWSDQNIVLDAVGAAEAGSYSTSRTPYLRELFQNLSPSSPVVTTILMKGAQLGASQLGLNLAGYIIDVGGGPALIVCPTIGMAELYSKQRLGPMIKATKVLNDKIAANTGKESGNTLLIKNFPGGMIRLTGGNSAAALKSMPAKWRIYEEPDEYPRDLEGQGNAVDLVRVRGRTYGKRAKEFLNCTPNLKSDSIIWQMYTAGDQRQYTMPCPHCGKGTVWNKELFRFTPGKPETAHMVCMHSDCGKKIEEAKHKPSMMEDGIWVPTIKAPPRDMPRSYYLPSFYSPIGWQSWSDIAIEIEAAEGKYEKTKTLWNTTFGLPWNDVTDTPSFEQIFERRSRKYRQRDVPEDVLFLTAGIDVGTDHIEVGVWGWSRKGRRKLIEHHRIRGRYNESETWAELDRFLQRRYWHPLGAALPIRRVFIDRSAWPSVVDPWVRRQDASWITAIMGRDSVDYTIREAVRREKMDDGTWARDESFKFFFLGATLLKLELYGQLNLKWDAGAAEPPGWVDLPEDVELGWVEQLVSEEYVTIKSKNGKGRPKSKFQPIGSVRHEALDCANYARAAAYSMGWDNWSEVDFVRLEKEIRDTAARLQLELARRQSNGRAGDVDSIVGELVRARPVAAEVPTPEQVSVIPADTQEVPMTPIDTETKAKLVPAKPTVKPWGNIASTWGGNDEIQRPSEIGIVGCNDEAQTSIPEPKIRTAWDSDDDDV